MPDNDCSSSSVRLRYRTFREFFGSLLLLFITALVYCILLLLLYIVVTRVVIYVQCLFNHHIHIIHVNGERLVFLVSQFSDFCAHILKG